MRVLRVCCIRACKKKHEFAPGQFIGAVRYRRIDSMAVLVAFGLGFRSIGMGIGLKDHGRDGLRSFLTLYIYIMSAFSLSMLRFRRTQVSCYPCL